MPRDLGRPGAAAVWDGVENRPVPAGHVNRPVDLDRRVVFDLPGPVPRGAIEIHDVPVSWIIRVDLAMGDAPQTLVLSDLSEALTVEGRRLDDLNVDLGDLRARVHGEQERECRGDEDGWTDFGHGCLRLRAHHISPGVVDRLRPHHRSSCDAGRTHRLPGTDRGATRYP